MSRGEADDLLRTAVETPQDLRERINAWRRDDKRVALTPTMGALHEGHLSLLSHAKARADVTVATLFVNPTQFGPGEDYAAYPRDPARDAALLQEAGCDQLYMPSTAIMYPPGFATAVHVSGLTDRLCGAARPGHFDGVALVVTKLLNQARADIAVFGEKDWQQLAVIRRLAQDLDIDTEIQGAPTVRAADGLALSSRNAYLSPEERRTAPLLHAVLTEVAAETASGADLSASCAAGARRLREAGFETVDYVQALDGVTLEPPADLSRARVFGAAKLGKARLIDNVPVRGSALPT